MKKDINVAGEIRDTRGKNEARRTRRAGKIPAVVYGGAREAVAIAVSPRELNQIIHSSSGYNTIFNLAVNGDTTPVMIVDHQNDPIRGTLLHADLKRIDLSKRLRVTVPVVTQGDPKGVKQQGGHFEVVNRTVEVECLPDDIPAHYTLDATELMLGQNLRASDIRLAEGIKLLSSPDSVIAHVVALRGGEEKPASEAAEVPVAAEGAQPEVIKKGKKEEEGAAGDKGGKKK